MIYFIIIQLLVVAALISVPAFYQADRFAEGKTIDHTFWAVLLCAIYSAFLGLMVLIENIDFPMFAAWFGFFLSARFLFFDALLNKLRRLPKNHLGNNPMDEAIKFLDKYISIPMLRIMVFMVGSFFAISETARFYNQEQLTAVVIFISIFIAGAVFTYNYYKRPDLL